MNSSQIGADHAPLRSLSAAAGLPIGTCVDMAALEDEPRYGETIAREFNMCVAENHFKPAFVWKGPQLYDFEQTDRLAQFARDNAITLRGHTLVWHQSVPRWLWDGGTYSAGEVRDMLREYIHAIVGRYKGVVAMWDVVNEAVSDGEGSDWRTDSFWFETLGPEYLDLAFHWAHEADPQVLLYYNDYEAEGMDPKSDRIYKLVRDMQASGTPIHGVGLQGHLINGWRLADEHCANVRRLVDLGLDWQITECDIRMVLNGNPPTEEQLQEQAAGYRDLIELCLTEPRCKGFVLWGFTDKHSWIPGFRKGQGAALPLDENYQPKPAYYAIAEALREYAEA